MPNHNSETKYKSVRSRFPLNMLILREELENASMSFNRNGDLCFQALLTRKRGREPMEQFVVNARKDSTMFFHLVWDQTLNDGEGDWTAINAILCSDLEELYATAGEEVRSVLDDHRWASVG
jgi:hypothetical protein